MVDQEPYQKLEEEWARWNNLPREGMVASSSGTAALHLALEAFRLPPKAKVIVPNLTMIACPRAVTLAGLEPVFVDCDDTLNMDQSLFNVYLVDSCRAVMYVHIYGRQTNIDRYMVDEGELLVIEDLAEAHGVKPHPKTDAACWSFYKNKIIHGEEGGAVWFRDPQHATLARQLRSLGFTAAHDFLHTPRGCNYRLANTLAQLVRNSLENSEYEMTERWREIERLDAACPAGWRMPKRDAPWVYDLRIPWMTFAEQDKVVSALNGVGILARHCFKPCERQPEYHQHECISRLPRMFTESRQASRSVIYLGLQPGRPRIDQIAFRIIADTLAKG